MCATHADRARGPRHFFISLAIIRFLMDGCPQKKKMCAA